MEQELLENLCNNLDDKLSKSRKVDLDDTVNQIMVDVSSPDFEFLKEFGAEYLKLNEDYKTHKHPHVISLGKAKLIDYLTKILSYGSVGYAVSHSFEFTAISAVIGATLASYSHKTNTFLPAFTLVGYLTPVILENYGYGVANDFVVSIGGGIAGYILDRLMSEPLKDKISTLQPELNILDMWFNKRKGYLMEKYMQTTV